VRAERARQQHAPAGQAGHQLQAGRRAGRAAARRARGPRERQVGRPRRGGRLHLRHLRLRAGPAAAPHAHENTVLACGCRAQRAGRGARRLSPAAAPAPATPAPAARGGAGARSAGGRSAPCARGLHGAAVPDRWRAAPDSRAPPTLKGPGARLDARGRAVHRGRVRARLRAVQPLCQHRLEQAPLWLPRARGALRAPRARAAARSAPPCQLLKSSLFTSALCSSLKMRLSKQSPAVLAQACPGSRAAPGTTQWPGAGNQAQLHRSPLPPGVAGEVARVGRAARAHPGAGRPSPSLNTVARKSTSSSGVPDCSAPGRPATSAASSAAARGPSEAPPRSTSRAGRHARAAAPLMRWTPSAGGSYRATGPPHFSGGGCACPAGRSTVTALTWAMSGSGTGGGRAGHARQPQAGRQVRVGGRPPESTSGQSARGSLCPAAAVPERRRAQLHGSAEQECCVRTRA